MKFLINTLAIWLITFGTLLGGNQSLTNFNQSADAFLKKHVKNGKVDYKTLKSNFIEIDQLYQSLGSVNVNDLSKDEKMAFYINAYNIIVIRQITDYYPLKSALDKNGFFDKVKHKVGGEMLTLDQIEKGKVIIPFRDPRVHFAFSCAAIGCPELGNFAYTASNLNAKLNERTNNAINNPEFIKVNAGKNEVKLSMIFKWYAKDFTVSAPDVLAYINDYRNQKIPSSYAINYYPYDWSLNIQ